MADREWISAFTAELREQEGDLADGFFEKTTNAVDFEIALAAFIATLCLQYPVKGLEIPISQLSAFSLLIVTLSRRIAVSSPYASEDLLEKTVVIIEVATTSCLLSIFTSIAYKIELPTFSVASLFIIISLPSMLLLAIIHELVFRDYMIWWHAKFLEKAEDEGLFNDAWVILSIITLWSSKYYRDLPDIDRHRRNLPSREDFRDKFDLSWKSHTKFVIKVALLLGTLYFFPLVPSIAVFGLSGVVMIPAVVAIHDQSAFWYVGYGDTSYEDFRRRPRTIIILTSAYIIEIGYLLQYYTVASVLKGVQIISPLFALFTF